LSHNNIIQKNIRKSVKTAITPPEQMSSEILKNIKKSFRYVSEMPAVGSDSGRLGMCCAVCGAGRVVSGEELRPDEQTDLSLSGDND